MGPPAGSGSVLCLSGVACWWVVVPGKGVGAVRNLRACFLASTRPCNDNSENPQNNTCKK